jgi:hypothetical protein
MSLLDPQHLISAFGPAGIILIGIVALSVVPIAVELLRARSRIREMSAQRS